MFKALCIIALLLILATVAQQAWVARVRVAAWQDTLYVGLYPVASDSAEATRRYVAALPPDSFAGIESYFAAEAKRHGLQPLQPVSVRMASSLAAVIFL